MKVYGGGGAAHELPNSGVPKTPETKSAREAWETIAPIAVGLSYEAEQLRKNNKEHEVDNVNAGQQIAMPVGRDSR